MHWDINYMEYIQGRDPKRDAPRRLYSRNLDRKYISRHLIQTKTNGEVLHEKFPDTKSALGMLLLLLLTLASWFLLKHTYTDTLEESIKITLDRIVSKERYINNQFDNMQYKFRDLKQKLEMAEKRFETCLLYTSDAADE